MSLKALEYEMQKQMFLWAMSLTSVGINVPFSHAAMLAQTYPNRVGYQARG